MIYPIYFYLEPLNYPYQQLHGSGSTISVFVSENITSHTWNITYLPSGFEFWYKQVFGAKTNKRKTKQNKNNNKNILRYMYLRNSVHKLIHKLNQPWPANHSYVAIGHWQECDQIFTNEIMFPHALHMWPKKLPISCQAIK